MVTKNIIENTSDFISIAEKINWFSKCGDISNNYTVASSFIEAWDSWNESMLNVWSVEVINLENISINVIGNDSIDYIFDKVSDHLGPIIEKCFYAFQIRQENMGLASEDYGLSFEIIDFIKRDTAWACIESILDREGFFSKVFVVNSTGRWACSWDGSYPDGHFVVM
ncbi:hypothetical protein CSC2_09290 [Clostridium zeae]|uniref:Uncharacterized protein n=1 Tax=Clostridium zeae TaxID=2759022 RepID=A0ABQ1E6Q5_9CLOT|nr:hypothetical protein [Clostridium zeae]GFZ30403.1 hypothetical protein CSC2_09290 [Clostridium zeae]